MSVLSTNVSACIGAGICANTAPEVFELDANGLVVIKTVEVEAAQVDSTDAAIAMCPAAALAWANKDA
ncbi:ferredoxin [Leucobacter sp. L43]|uniref:ferredoxin n=1 Tax=Leucobacter sp. L43 TaxID=2798040 RepID=UPI0019062969|nr:ferredoxin [Leucobacter sp. L43]